MSLTLTLRMVCNYKTVLGLQVASLFLLSVLVRRCSVSLVGWNKGRECRGGSDRISGAGTGETQGHCRRGLDGRRVLCSYGGDMTGVLVLTISLDLLTISPSNQLPLQVLLPWRLV